MTLKKIKVFSKRAILTMASFALLSACEKPTDGLGFEQVIGSTIEADTIHVPIISYTTAVDSILVALPYQQQLLFGGYNSTRLLGRTVSSNFGTEEARLLAQLLPEQVNPDFGDNPVIDSVNLYLRITEAYGDTSVPMNISVSELEQTFSKDSSFFSNYSPLVGQEIGRLDNYMPQPKTNVFVEDLLAPATIRVPLDLAFFQSKFADVGNGEFDSLASFTNFVEYFKGIEVKTENGGCVLYTNLASNYSLIRIYYHNDLDTTFTDLSFNQDKSTVPITFSTFNQDYSNSDIDLSSIDSTTAQDLTYVQAMGGVVTAFKFDLNKIDSLSQEGLIINRALIEFYTAQGLGTAVAPSPRMEVRLFNGHALGDRILDYQVDGGGDGNLRRGILRENRYVFDVSRQLFSVLNSGVNNSMAITPLTRTTAANRTILRGGKEPQKQAKVIIYYTKP
tara:strand:+ start:713 stop:2059 length:1347 start_codon:yes stop_codon:yes gene_type:complete